jgi:uncharacterized membrane protein
MQKSLAHSSKSTAPRRLLLIFISLYALGRIFQLFSAELPIVFTVIFHVIPPALFAIVHGARTYGVRGIATFSVICLGCASFFESLSLRTGFPFGHYVFTSVMGPKLFQLPILLALAYLSIGYSAWIVATLILGHANKRLSGAQILFTPLLASAVLLAWDLSMDADWATLDKAWLWRDGGAYFGVPISNFLGWYLTGYIIFQLFALYQRNRRTPSQSPAYWRLPVVLYSICAAGNLLLLIPLKTAVTYPDIVYDPSGHAWHTASILLAVAFVSVFIMGSFATLAWRRSNYA